MPISHAARLSPLQGETVWTLADGEVVERRGARERRFPVARLTRVTRAGRGATLRFGHRHVSVPSVSYGEVFHTEDRRQSFEAFVSAVATAAPGAPGRSAMKSAEALMWIIGLVAVGAVAVLLAAGLAGAWLLGLALACRLAFLAILGVAVLPWIGRPLLAHERELS